MHIPEELAKIQDHAEALKVALAVAARKAETRLRGEKLGLPKWLNAHTTEIFSAFVFLATLTVAVFELARK